MGNVIYKRIPSAIGDIKECSRCGYMLPMSAFYEAKRNSTGHQAWCRTCHRAHHLRRLYDFTYEDVIVHWFSKCAICGTDRCTGDKRALHVDHNHETGIIRDALCNDCNTTFGNMGENPKRIQAMLDYAEKHKDNLNITPMASEVAA